MSCHARRSPVIDHTRPAQDTGWSPDRGADRTLSRPDPQVRIGDRERDDTSAMLSAAYAQGYLTMPEFDQRAERVLAARTAGELDSLVVDLPVVEQIKAERRAESTRLAARRGLQAHLLSYAGGVVIMLAIWLVTAVAFGATYFWPVWPILGWGIGVVSHALPVLRGTGSGHGLNGGHPARVPLPR